MSTFAKVFLTKKRNLTFKLIFTSNISFFYLSLYKSIKNHIIRYIYHFFITILANNPLIEEILASVEIKDLIERYVPLSRA